MVRDTLLGFPAHTLPYRRGKSATLSTDSYFFRRRSLRQPPPQPLQAEFSAEEPPGQSTVTLVERPLRHGPLQRTLPEGVQLPAHGIVFPQGKFLLGVVFEKPFAQPFAHAGIAPVFEVTPEQILIYFFHRTSGF